MMASCQQFQNKCRREEPAGEEATGVDLMYANVAETLASEPVLHWSSWLDELEQHLILQPNRRAIGEVCPFRSLCGAITKMLRYMSRNTFESSNSLRACQVFCRDAPIEFARSC